MNFPFLTDSPNPTPNPTSLTAKICQVWQKCFFYAPFETYSLDSEKYILHVMP